MAHSFPDLTVQYNIPGEHHSMATFSLRVPAFNRRGFTFWFPLGNGRHIQDQLEMLGDLGEKIIRAIGQVDGATELSPSNQYDIYIHKGRAFTWEEICPNVDAAIQRAMREYFGWLITLLENFQKAAASEEFEIGLIEI